MEEKQKLDKAIIENLNSIYKETYFLIPFIISLIAYYIFFRFHHYAYEFNASTIFFIYFGPNIILFSLILSFIIYRYKYLIPLLEKNYSEIEIKSFSKNIILSFTIRFIPIVFLILQIFYYATNIYLEKSSFTLQTKIENVGYQFRFLAPANWVAIRLPNEELIYMQSLEAREVGELYEAKIHEGFWTKFTDL